MKRKIIFTFLLVLLMVATFGGGYFWAKVQTTCPVCKPEEVDFSLFWEAWNLLKKDYVNPEKFSNTQDLIYGAISGMVQSLGDPYTVFMKPEESKRFEEDVKGEFEGIGIEIGVKDGQLQVISPLEGTPAQKAGIRAGDKILKINGTSTADITVDEAVSIIRGKGGTKVTLEILRYGWESPKDFELVRSVIKIPSLKWELKETSDGEKIAYIRLYHFSEKAGYDFSQAVMEILSSSAKKIVLDLRDNPGGYLEVSQDIAGWFLEKGQLVVTEDFGDEREKQEYKAEGAAALLSYPTVVLINEGSASASEILAGALRDNRDILLIGEKSFGKGSVQELQNLNGGGSLKITIAKWLTPKGELIAEKGLEPDIKVERTEEDYKQDKDPQLDKALEIIKEMR